MLQRVAADFSKHRRSFPLLSERVYFAQQCLGVLPNEVEHDLSQYGQSLVRRSQALPEWAERFFAHHRLVEALIEAPQGSVFFRDSATAAQAAIAAAIEPHGERKRILLGTPDFHSSRYLWQGQERRGFEVLTLSPNGDDPGADSERLAAMIDDRVSVVALALVSPKTGGMIDAPKIAEAARRAGAILVLDAYQAVGVVPVRVAELGAQVVVGGFHKWLCGGGTGLAFGYVDPTLIDQLPVVYPGWFGQRDVLAFAHHFEPAANAQKLQQGMVAMEPVYTSRAGIQWVLDTGIDAIRQKSITLTERILAHAAERGLRPITPRAPELRGGMVCLDVPEPKRVVDTLARQRIDIDARPGAGIRIGPHACAEMDEVDRVMDAIAEAAR